MKLKGSIVAVEKTVTEHKQERYLNSIVISGVTETDDEDIIQVAVRLINSKIMNKCRHKVNISDIDINYCRRLGKKSDNRKNPRPLSVEFTNRWKRNLVFASKKHLKGTGVVISEQLVRSRLDLYNKVRTKVGMRSCWTFMGNVYASVNGVRRKVLKESDVSDCVNSDNVGN